jgi:Leucine-rich repeat (LRR) protein
LTDPASCRPSRPAYPSQAPTPVARRRGWILASLTIGLLAVKLCAVGPWAVAETATAPGDLQRRLAALGDAVTTETVDGTIVSIMVRDGSALEPDDIALFGSLPSLQRLQILNCRMMNDELVRRLVGLRDLRVLGLTNGGITDEGVQTVVEAFPDLVGLDLSSNTNLTGSALRSIAGLGKLEQLSLLQTRFNDLATRRLSRLDRLQTLDLRGNMEAGDMTLGVVGRLPALTGFKHRSTAVTDAGMEQLAASPALRSLLMQDFAITNDSGPHLAAIGTLRSLEIFRCQGFGSAGVLALADMKLERLTLRDLPDVDDSAFDVLAKLPELRRLYLHELPAVTDAGLARLADAPRLEVVDVWSVPRMSDATVEVLATLPNLRELSIRETSVSQDAVRRILSMPKLRSLTFKNNGPLSAEQAALLQGRSWQKLDLGR